MTDRYFFGYGSLVNLATHDYPNARRARLKGWRRVWQHTDLRAIPFLTVRPDPGCEIDGMIAHVPNDDWAALDVRERGYDRIPATEQIVHDVPQASEIAVYAVPGPRHVNPSDYPILLSYVDVVMQGYLHHFGAEGVDHFIATTDGWDITILNDRDQPRYPRHQALTPEETDFIDSRLRETPARIIRTDPSETHWA